MNKYDQFSYDLCQLLRDNCRITTTTLAKKLGCTRKKVMARINKLEEEGVIRGYYSSINVALTDWGFNAMIFIRIHSSLAFPIIREIIQLDEIIEIHHIAGEYNLVVYGWFKSNEDLQDFLINKLTIIHGIERQYIQILLRSYNQGVLVAGNPRTIKTKNTPFKLDDLDFKIARFLFTNGRATMAEIANTIDVSDQTVVNRLKRMITWGVISKFYTALDMNKFGIRHYASVSISVLPEKFKHVLESINKLKPLWLTETTGTNDLIVLLEAKSLEEIWEFLHDQLGKIVGILKTETHLILGRFFRNQKKPLHKPEKQYNK